MGQHREGENMMNGNCVNDNERIQEISTTLGKFKPSTDDMRFLLRQLKQRDKRHAKLRNALVFFSGLSVDGAIHQFEELTSND
jgi:hypothetical protein